MNEIMIKETKELANILSQSRLVSNWYKNEQDAFFALQFGRELGLVNKPVQALMNIHVVNSRPCPSSDLLLAVAKGHPQYAGTKIEITSDKCVVEMKRKLQNGEYESVVSPFSMKDAEIAGLLVKDNWKKYPKRMLKARAISYAVRDLFPDSFAGIMSVEEVEDMPIPTIIEDENGDIIVKTDQLKEEINVLFDKLVENGMINQGEIPELEQMMKDAGDEEGKLIGVKKFLASRDKEININKEKATIVEIKEEPMITPEIAKLHQRINDGLKALKYEEKHKFHSIKKHLKTDTVGQCLDKVCLTEYIDYLLAEFTKNSF